MSCPLASNLLQVNNTVQRHSLSYLQKVTELSEVVATYSATTLVWMPGMISIMDHTHIRGNKNSHSLL